MPYQALDIPRFKTTPYPEADMVKKASGVDFDTPTLALMSEGNRRALRNSGIPILVEIESAFTRGGSNTGTHIIEHNLTLLAPRMSPKQYQETAIHEASHALRAHLLDYKSPPKGVRPDLDPMNHYRDNLGWRIYEEGFAEYWEETTKATQLLGLTGPELRKHRHKVIDDQLKIVDGVRTNIFDKADLAAYPMGHYLINKLIGNLELVVGAERALQIVGTAEVTSLEDVFAAISGIRKPKFINLSLTESLRYSANLFVANRLGRDF